MPTESSAQKLAKLVKTAQNKVVLINQAHSLINDLSKVVLPPVQDIQNKYPLLHKILLECYSETSKVFYPKKIEQKHLEQMLSDLNLLEEVAFTAASAVDPLAIDDELYKWVTENVSEAAITSCATSNEMVGGMVISYRGRFVDLSLDKAIREKVYA